MSDIVKNEDNIEVDISQFDNVNCQNKGGIFAPQSCPDGQYSPYMGYVGTSYTIQTADGLQTFYTYCPTYGDCIVDPSYIPPVTTAAPY